MTFFQMMLLAGGASSFLYGSLAYFNPLREHVIEFLIVYGFLFLIYLLLVWRLTKNTLRHPVGATMASLVVFALLFRVLMLRTQPSLSDDIYRYVWDGRVQQAGINPYLYPPSDPLLIPLRDTSHSQINNPTISSIYPPLTQWIYRLGAALHPTIGMQRILFLMFDIGSIVLLMFLLPLAGRSSLWALIYAWNPLVVVEFAGSGHNDSLMIFTFLLGLYFYMRARPNWGAGVFGLATLSKIVPGVMIPWLLLKRNKSPVFIYAGVIFFLSALFLSEFANGFFFPAGFKSYVKDWVFNPSFYGLLKGVWNNPVGVKIVLGTAFFLFSLWWARRNLNDPIRYALGAVTGLLLISPVIQPWYVIWIVPFLCFIPLWSGLLWTGLVGLTYVVLIRYTREGVWELPVWVNCVEYGLLFSMLTWGIRKKIIVGTIQP